MLPPGELRCDVKCYRRRQTTDDDRRQPALLVWPVAPYTMCRRASNKLLNVWSTYALTQNNTIMS